MNAEFEVPFTNNFAQHFGSAFFILHGNLSFQMMLYCIWTLHIQLLETCTIWHATKRLEPFSKPIHARIGNRIASPFSQTLPSTLGKWLTSLAVVGQACGTADGPFYVLFQLWSTWIGWTRKVNHRKCNCITYMALSNSALTKGHCFSPTHLPNAQLKALFSPSKQPGFRPLFALWQVTLSRFCSGWK